MKKDLLKDFFNENFSNINIFNHNEGEYKNSPLIKFINNNLLIKIKNRLKNQERENNNKININVIATSLAITLSIYGLSYITSTEKINNAPHQSPLNNITSILETKQIENNIPSFINFDIEKEKLTINNEEIKGIKLLSKDERLNIDWDFKTPPEKFAYYYTSTFSNSLPSKIEINEIENFYGIPKNTIYYMAFKESRFNLEAESHKKAKGLLGFMDSTAKEFNLITEENNFIEQKNGYATADAAARYILWLNSYVNGYNSDIFNNKKDKNGFDNLDYTLAAYNAGPNKIIRYINNDGTKKRRIPNYKETKNYIKDIKMLINKEGYIVQKNDTLDKISKKLNIDKLTIVRNNLNLSNNQDLKYGTVINIKNNPHQEIEIVVERGFNMYMIAKNTGSNIHHILQYNNMNEKSVLSIGEKIKIPPISKKLIKIKNNT